MKKIQNSKKNIWLEISTQRLIMMPLIILMVVLLASLSTMGDTYNKLTNICYFGLVISLFPYAIPYHISFKDAAAATTSLSFLLVGVALILPVILCYTAFSYHVFRGKSSHEHMY